MKRLVVLTLGVLVAACGDGPLEISDGELAPPTARSEITPLSLNIVDLANAQLEAMDADYRVAYAEYLTADYFGNSQNVVFARDLGNKRMDAHFLPDDERRAWSGSDPNTIAVLVDLMDGATASGLDETATTQAIYSALETWEDVTCSDLGLMGYGAEQDFGVVQFFLGAGGSPFVFADLTHAGWMPGPYFDQLAPNGSQFILGVTFTFVFQDDANGDGQPDVAFREIYYNDAFPWGIGAGVDVESVALHEMGHGLSQGHFGTVFFNRRSGKLNFSPLAVMNAVYAAPNRELDGTDTAGHCGIWARWPTR